MEKKEKKLYEAPALTTVSFKAERGYAASNIMQSMAFSILDFNATGDGSSSTLNDYNTHDEWVW